MPIQRIESSSAPMLSSAETPRDASSFITTARQSPSSGSHSSVRSPPPAVDATQNVSLPGGALGVPPGAGVLRVTVAVEVVDHVALDASEVPRDLGGRPDPDEHRAVALAANPDRAEERVERPLGSFGVEVGALGNDRVRLRREVLRR